MNYEELKKRYPSQVCCNTGEASDVYKSINNFFDDITYFVDSQDEKLLTLNPGRVRLHPSFERTLFYLIAPRFATKQRLERDEPEKISNKTVHLLKYKNRTLATVVETRTESNLHDFAFFERIEDALKEK